MDRDVGNELQDQISANEINSTNDKNRPEPPKVPQVMHSGIFTEPPLKLVYENAPMDYKDADVATMFSCMRPIRT